MRRPFAPTKLLDLEITRWNLCDLSRQRSNEPSSNIEPKQETSSDKKRERKGRKERGEFKEEGVGGRRSALEERLGERGDYLAVDELEDLYK
jgi:hypothetical protein